VATPVRTSLVALGLSLAIFLLYFAAYPIRHLQLPMGFDPPYYVWRAQYLASQGIGSGATAARPGHTILSVILSSLTGRSQLELAVVLTLLMVSLLALAVGAFCRSALGFDRRGWMIAVVTTGVVLGPTHLVGENLATILFLVLIVGALVPLADRVGGGRGFCAAAAMAVTSGLAHWDFLAVFAVVLAAVFALTLPGALRQVRAGVPALDTEAGILAAFAAAIAAAMSALIFVVLRAPLRTTDIPRDPQLYLSKFRTDLTRLYVAAPVGLVAGPAIRAFDHASTRTRGPGEAVRFGFSVRMLEAWSLVMAAGVVYSLFGLHLPPARFLALLVALPGAAGVAALLSWVARRSSARSVAILVLALLALTIPGALRWYQYPVLMQASQLQEARTADGYVRSLPPNQAVVFLVGYEGYPPVYESVVKERTIRIGLSPDRATDAHVFVGSPADLLAGRRTPPPDARTDRVTLLYWNDVEALLPSNPPILILQSMAPDEFVQAQSLGATVIGQGVELLRGPRPPNPLPVASVRASVPNWFAGPAWAAAMLILLAVAGAGWTCVFLRPGSPVETRVSLAPVVGAGVLILGGIGAAELRIPLGGAGGVGTFVVVAGAGFALAAMDARRRRLASGPESEPAADLATRSA
jgi:hypothetical protein